VLSNALDNLKSQDFRLFWCKKVVSTCVHVKGIYYIAIFLLTVIMIATRKNLPSLYKRKMGGKSCLKNASS